jgi:hypothetical protein
MDGDKERDEGFKGATFLAKEAKYFVKIDVAFLCFVLRKMKAVSQLYFQLCKQFSLKS